MLKKLPRLLAGLLALVMAFSLAACGADTPAADPSPEPSASAEPEATPEPTPEATPEPAPEASEAPAEEAAAETKTELEFAIDEFMAKPLNAPVVDVAPASTGAADPEAPLVVGYDKFSEKFSPFFYQTGYDGDAVGVTQLTTYNLDRAGQIIYNGIEGETRNFNGVDYFYQTPVNLFEYYDEATDTGYYRIRLRDDLKFSDGVPVTADDLIFSIYVYMDPDYDGLANYTQEPIKGLRAYLTQVEDAAYDKFAPIVTSLYEAGPDHVWASTDAWDEATQTKYWEGFKTMWVDTCQQIVDYVVANYASVLQDGDLGPYTADDLADNPGLQTTMGMLLWNFGKTENNIFTTASGKTFDLSAGEFPTVEDYYNETFAAYEGDFTSYWDTEKTSDTTSAQAEIDAYNAVLIRELAEAESGSGAGVPNVAGIKKIDDYTVEFQTDGFDSTVSSQLFSFPIAPLHYYGDPAQYDYENNKFGFPYGDLSIPREKTTTPLGAGPLVYKSYENETIYYEGNPNYWKGATVTKNVQWKYVPPMESVPGVVSGVIDAGELNYTLERDAEVSGYNSNGTMEGDVLDARSVMNRGYGYIGLFAPSICVDGDPGSDASKNLRKAISTIISVHRDTSINSYYGAGASVIQYPVSSVSWGSPQPTDEGYEVAFSTGVDGRQLYTAEMTPEEKYEAAKVAAAEYFAAAGFTVENGVVTAPPPGDGVRKTVYDGDQSYLEYEVIIPANGAGDHPSFGLLTDAKDSFADIGINLIINDPADANVLWSNKDAGTTDMWVAAWGNSQADPHASLQQTYHSSSRSAAGMTDYNDYGVSSTVIDEALEEARSSSDQAYRKSLYKTVLDEVMDWAVEVPVYQRRLYNIYSSERVNIDTLNEGSTPFVLSLDPNNESNYNTVEMR